MITAHALSMAVWRKSSYSNGEGGACVEVADSFPGFIPVRDSKSADGPVVAIAVEAWVPFVTAVKTEAL
ncbi:hypothetical protein M2271_007180 [Streptomyces sp. LBL]|uniref:DUF397 domain-containing protein n=1 Tax=Streptomyces sp. LBL TaxID=2940562 RepID=UPI0024765A06|nr:DUF397 domain-containing protein [Streptomyces sp. LBL]MDH6629344.1 hypothetical protein [Streptomyces sp. LBL]